MLSFASVAYSEDQEFLGEFEANLIPLDGASQYPDTMAWWKTEPEAWNYSTLNPQDPKTVMHNYVNWIKTLPGEVLFTACPASFDFMWIDWYLWKFVGKKVFSGPALCIQSRLSGITGKNFRDCHRSSWPESWLGEFKHNHKAIDDARGYARAYFLMFP